MPYNFGDNVQFNKNYILQAVLENLASHPSNPKAGQIYWNTTDTTAYICSNATGPVWSDLLAGGGVTDHTLLSNIGSNTHAQIDTHLASTSNPHSVTKSQVGLGSVDNTSDVNKPVSTAQQTALDLKIDDTEKGANNGVATLDGSGTVPASQLPSYVDDVIEAANFAALPGTGETGKIYITLDDNRQYRWTGSIYALTGEYQDGVAIKALYEGEANTNAFTDTEQTKLGTIAGKYAANLTGDGVATVFNFNHGLNTLDLSSVTIWEVSTGLEWKLTVTKTDANNISVTFGDVALIPNTKVFRVVVNA